MLKDFLIISKLGKEVPRDFQSLAFTNSPEAYRYFIYGNNAYLKRDFPTAIKLYSQAIDIDSNFIFATIQLSIAYHIIGWSDQAKKWCLRVYKKRDQMPLQQKIWTNRIYAQCFETPYEQIMYLKQLQEFDDQVPVIYYDLGRNYNELDQYDKAIPEFEKALEIYNKWDSKPMWAYNYILLGESYHKTGQYKKEKELYKKAEQDFPNDNAIIYEKAILSLTEKDTVAANRYIEKCLSDYKDNSDFELIKSNFLANIFSEAGIIDKAEKYYQKVLMLRPDNPMVMNDFGFFLIDKNININEGLVLVDKALKLSPDNLYFLDTKGWGLYKRGEYQEALKVLEKSDSLKPVYNHELYLHLEAVKKAIANQKKN
jgi:tetratricopeptide (TPR) repeat protein